MSSFGFSKNHRYVILFQTIYVCSVFPCIPSNLLSCADDLKLVFRRTRTTFFPCFSILNIIQHVSTNSLRQKKKKKKTQLRYKYSLNIHDSSSLSTSYHRTYSLLFLRLKTQTLGTSVDATKCHGKLHLQRRKGDIL